MNREQMVTQAVADILDYFDDNTPDNRDAESAARQIVATLLPQVSTVAELETLPQSTWLIGQVGSGGFATYQVNTGGRLDCGGRLVPFASALRYDSPLTVVWTPGVTA